ncbi:MAG: FecR domain-containing protein [Pseudomonadota bacterium]
MILIGLASWIWVQAAGSTVAPVESPSLVQSGPELHQTGWGKRSEVTLSDGSRIWLDWRTKLAVAYSETSRQISIERGTAAFKVTSNVARPFIVEAHGARIVVTGTEFSVKVSEQRVDIGVIEGSVRVHADAEVATLSKGHHIGVEAGNLEEVTVRGNKELAGWRDGMLVFDRRPLQQVITDLSRYLPYEVDTQFILPGTRLVTAVYFVDEAEQGLVSLLKAHHLEAEQTTRGITLREARLQRPL